MDYTTIQKMGLRTHPKMTKSLLDDIENMRSKGSSTEEISAALKITPASVERGYSKLSERKRMEVHALRGGAFTAVTNEKRRRSVCTAINCEWHGPNHDYCCLPSCFKERFRIVKEENAESEVKNNG